MNDSVTVKAWEEVVSHFRRACFLRRQGNHPASESILKETLPGKIAEWSKTASQHVDSKKALLECMFREEQRKVDEAWALQELAATHWQEKMMPELSRQVSQEVQSVVREQMASMSLPHQSGTSTSTEHPKKQTPRPAFDDIPAIIDLIVAEEKRTVPRKKTLAA